LCINLCLFYNNPRTASISCQNLIHFGGNMFAMFLFGWKAHRVISMPQPSANSVWLKARFGGCSCHLAMEFESMKQLEHAHPPQANDRLRCADKPSLGASSCVMSIAAWAGWLYPMDRMLFRNKYSNSAVCCRQHIFCIRSIWIDAENMTDHVVEWRT